jgi:hypothetical protein
MNISTVGKVEVATALGSVGAGIVGAVLLEPILLIGAAVGAVAATVLQVRESRIRKTEDETRAAA